LVETDGGPVEERPADSTTAGPAPAGAPGTELKPLSRMQRVVGERMQQSWQQAPHHYATVEVHVDDLLALRTQLNAGLEEDGIKLSINDFVMKGCAVALRKFPKLNSLWTSEGIEWHAGVDLAAALDTPIYAASAGTVIVRRERGGYGLYILVVRDPRLSTLYGHLDFPVVETGHTVTSGQLIALMGSTGNSTGPHLHFEVRIAGGPVDPLPLVPELARGGGR